MKNKKNILLLAYKFPPYTGIGARRWAKFAKYFSSHGVKLFVITNKWKNDSQRGWLKDIEDNSLIEVLRLTTPLNVMADDKSLIGKILFKTNLILSKIFTWTDEAYYFFKFNQSRIFDLIEKNNINVVIATGGPFSANYFGGLVKQKFPHIKLIQDFRDLWTEEYFYEFPDRSETSKIYQKELSLEKFGLSNSDIIVSVTPGCVERIKKTCDRFSIKNKTFHLIENGFDPSDKKVYEESDYPSHLFDKSKYNISHFGTAGFGREKEFLEFMNSIEDRLTESVHFHFFGYFGNETRNKLEIPEFRKIVSFHEYMPTEEIQLFMYFSNMHLVINDPVWYFAYGTKIFDAFLYKKPVLLISRGGDLYELISNNNIGLVTNNSEGENKTLVTTLEDIIQNKTLNNFFNREYNYEKHSIPCLTEKYLQLINN